MNSDGLPPQPPKKSLRFKPKPPPRRVVRAPTRATGADDAARAAGLLIHQQRSQISHNVTPGGDNNSYETGTVGDTGDIDTNASSSRHGDQRAPSFPSADISADESASSNPVVTKEIKKEYIGPWGNVCNPPTTLPLRRPSSEDPEILNDLEFGGNQITEPNESYDAHATELGLNENNEEPKLISIHLPLKLPIPQSFFRAKQPDTSKSSVHMIKADPSAKGKGIVTSPPVSGEGSVSPPRIETAPTFPPPHAKVQVYASGKVKMKMGEILFDVAPGIHSETMAQDLVAINTKDKKFYQLGEIEKMMVVTPDFSDFFIKQNHMKSKSF